MTETVNHPGHYGGDVKFEAIKLIDDWGLGFSGGNALKYLVRARHKGSEMEDLQKALWYVRHAIEVRESPGWFRFLFRRTKLDPVEASHYHKLSFHAGVALTALHDGRLRLAEHAIIDEISIRRADHAGF